MGWYDIEEVSGTFTDVVPLDTWQTSVTLGQGMTVVSGDFDMVDMRTNTSTGEALSYSFGPLSNPGFGTLTGDPVTGQFTFTIDWAAVQASGASQTISFIVTGTLPNGGTDQDTVIIDLLICFAEGMRIATPTGARPVEALREGDLVLTRDHGPQPVRWIGRRKISREELAACPALAPIRIRAGALGPGCPERDLRVSPNHRMLIEDWRVDYLFGHPAVLVQAKDLVDGDGVVQDPPTEEITYYHLLLDRHEVLIAEGAPTESFYPGPWTLSEIGSEALGDLFRRNFTFALAPGAFGPLARPALASWEAAVLRALPATTAVDKAA